MPRFVTFGRSPAQDAPHARRSTDVPDWEQADPRRIERALQRALAKPTGGWAVLDASDRIGAPRRFEVAGRELVAWRAPDGPRVAPDACPHMGASLCEGRVDDGGRIVCPWHGLALGDRRHGTWGPLVVHDDGVLTWVRSPSLLTAEGDVLSDAPVLPARPEHFLHGVIRTEARCEPRDVLANRLDPWHGAHFHPHSFLRLFVVDDDDEQITVRVVYKVVGPLGVEVDARFDCPDARTIVMTIVAGEGVGSVVETHATPLGDGRTAVVEATLATSERAGFAPMLRLSRFIRPMIEKRAARLWVEDAAYAERTYALREKPLRLRLIDREPREGQARPRPQGGR
jgi:hypothetical protein